MAGEHGVAATVTAAAGAMATAAVGSAAGAGATGGAHDAVTVELGGGGEVGPGAAAGGDAGHHGAGAGDGDNGGHAGDEHFVGESLVLLICFLLVIGLFVRMLYSTKFFKRHVAVPFTVMLMVIGMLLGVWYNQGDAHGSKMGLLSGAFELVDEMNPEAILLFFLPALIFESAFNTNTHVFGKVAGQAMIMAGPIGE